MPRTLPWLGRRRVRTPAGNTPDRLRGRAAPLSPGHEVPRDSPSKRRKFVHVPNLDERTPSTSPPPAPPTEEFMREGYENDDGYIMVEDEFLAVAKSFTQHLHHAEYMRLKELAKSQNASTIHTISRPVDTRTTMRKITAKRNGARQRGKWQAEAVGKLNAGNVGSDEELSDLDEDKEDDPWFGTSLHSLMTSPRKVKTSLSYLARLKPGTKAAAGFSKPGAPPARDYRATSPLRIKERGAPLITSFDEEETASETEDDDLDGPVYAKGPHQTQLQPPKQTTGPELVSSMRPSPDLPSSPPIKLEPVESQSKVSHRAELSSSRRRRQTESQLTDRIVRAPSLGLDSSDEDLPSFFKPESERFLSKRTGLERPEEHNSTEQKKPSASIMDIPTFTV